MFNHQWWVDKVVYLVLCDIYFIQYFLYIVPLYIEGNLSKVNDINNHRIFYMHRMPLWVRPQQIQQDACTGVHSAFRQEENGTIWIFVYYAVYGSGRGRCRDFLVLKWGGGVLICKYWI